MEQPSWRVMGTIGKARSMASPKTGEVWRYIFGVVALGGTFEVEMEAGGNADEVKRSAEFFARHTKGTAVDWVGSFSEYQGRLKLVYGGEFKPVEASKGKVA